MSRFSAPKRTDADRKMDAVMFVANARDDIVLAATTDELCARYGVQGRDARREVEAKLLAKQARLRRAA